MKKRYGLPLLIISGIWAWNSSLLASAPENPNAKLLSHRGVHQTFHREGLQSDTCTADRIFPVEHPYIENTVPSARAAFEAGADVVEIDIYLTSDGKFVVFHDWTLDCRTNSTGVTNEKTLTELQKLDVGFGYTADGGKTYPLRGNRSNRMPELVSFLNEFRDKKFLVNFKSNNPDDGKKFVKLIQHGTVNEAQLLAVYGGPKPTRQVTSQIDNSRGFSRPQIKDCLKKYASIGWTGYVPKSCKNTFVMVPINFAPMLWGWPDRFQKRIKSANSEIILIGPMTLNAPGTTGIDDKDLLKAIPESFDGYIWTNRIEKIGPEFASDKDQ